jgi:protein phosphatase 4 regulatory subunit 3
MDSFSNCITLPDPELGNLPDIEHVIRIASGSQTGRESLSKFLLREDYVAKIIPLVEMSEDLESLQDLHKLCNVMKSLILLNDNAIIEHLVSDDIITGVVGALEYDPDFPTHKANHRQYLNDTTRYKEVVPIRDQVIQQKIRNTWRLQYLKDVVLARIIDDPTFSVLNSIIFFHQVEIVQHLQGNAPFLDELFSVFEVESPHTDRREDAVHFIHQSAAIAKNLQAPTRNNLFSDFIGHGLLEVITFAITHPNPSMRTTGIDILVALLDHDPLMMRGYMLRAVHDKRPPLTDTMIELLHTETDLGVKNQLADAIKILLDPHAPGQEPPINRTGVELISKNSRPPQISPSQAANEQFAQDHFDGSCKTLFRPLRDIRERTSMHDLSYQEVSLHTHLVEILTYFVRSHSTRSRHFVLSEQLPAQVALLLQVSQKSLKLTALKFFRTCISLQDQFYVKQMMLNNTFKLILDIVIQTMPRDNLLNSACLEMFEYVKRESIKTVILHVVEKYRDKLKDITYVDSFQNLMNRYDQMQADNVDVDHTLFREPEESTPPPTMRSRVNGGQRYQGIKEMDTEQEDYFNASDDDDDDDDNDDRENAVHARADRFEWHSRRLKNGGLVNGNTFRLNASAHESKSVEVAGGKPLVDYPDDEDDTLDLKPSSGPLFTPQTPGTPESMKSEKDVSSPETTGRGVLPRLQPSPDIPEKILEKRRREVDEFEDDELSKLTSGVKRRNSTSSSHSNSGNGGSDATASLGLRRRKSFLRSRPQQSTGRWEEHSPTVSAMEKSPSPRSGTHDTSGGESRHGNGDAKHGNSSNLLKPGIGKNKIAISLSPILTLKGVGEDVVSESNHVVSINASSSPDDGSDDAKNDSEGTT